MHGGGPGTRETDTLRPLANANEANAILITGGSAFGLAAADGVVRWLEEHERGYFTPFGRVPLVPAAVIYDLPSGEGEGAARAGRGLRGVRGGRRRGAGARRRRGRDRARRSARCSAASARRQGGVGYAALRHRDGPHGRRDRRGERVRAT